MGALGREFESPRPDKLFIEGQKPSLEKIAANINIKEKILLKKEANFSIIFFMDKLENLPW